jgi:hypothetical protein
LSQSKYGGAEHVLIVIFAEIWGILMPIFRNIATIACILIAFVAMQSDVFAKERRTTTIELQAASGMKEAEASFTNAKILQESVAVAGNLVGAPQAANQFLTLDTTTIRCPRRNCRIEAVMYAQASTSVVDNPFAICFRVDGLFGDLGCPTIGELQPGNATFLFGHDTLNLKTGLSRGNHTIQIQYFSTKGTSVHSYAGFFKSYTK